MDCLDYKELRSSRYEHFRDPTRRFILHWAKCSQVIVIAPTRAAADECARDACENAPLGALVNALEEVNPSCK
jgi:hypothetical protein